MKRILIPMKRTPLLALSLTLFAAPHLWATINAYKIDSSGGSSWMGNNTTQSLQSGEEIQFETNRVTGDQEGQFILRAYWRANNGSLGGVLIARDDNGGAGTDGSNPYPPNDTTAFDRKVKIFSLNLPSEGSPYTVCAQAIRLESGGGATIVESWPNPGFGDNGNAGCDSGPASVTIQEAALGGPTSFNATVVNASQINLGWTASSDNRVDGYILDWSVDNVNFNNIAFVSGRLTTSHSFTTASPSTSYYFRIKAYRSNPYAESTPSDIGPFTTPSGADTSAPTLSNLTLSPPTPQPAGTTAALITLDTNKNANCKVGLAGTPYGSMVSFNSTGGTNHSLTLSNLIDGYQANYDVICQNSNPGGQNSAPANFSINVQTPTGDSQAPQLSSLGPTGTVSGTSVVLTVTTNEIAECRVSNNNVTGTPYENLRIMPSGNGTTHQLNETVVAGTNYRFELVCRNGSFNFSPRDTNFIQFSVSGGGAPQTPVITSLNPPSVVVGGMAFNLEINGTGFSTTDSKVVWGIGQTDQEDLTPSRTATKLTVAIAANKLTTARRVNIVVINPTPAPERVSNEVGFDVTTPGGNGCSAITFDPPQGAYVFSDQIDDPNNPQDNKTIRVNSTINVTLGYTLRRLNDDGSTGGTSSGSLNPGGPIALPGAGRFELTASLGANGSCTAIYDYLAPSVSIDPRQLPLPVSPQSQSSYTTPYTVLYRPSMFIRDGANNLTSISGNVTASYYKWTPDAETYNETICKQMHESPSGSPLRAGWTSFNANGPFSLNLSQLPDLSATPTLRLCLVHPGHPDLGSVPVYVINSHAFLITSAAGPNIVNNIAWPARSSATPIWYRSLPPQTPADHEKLARSETVQPMSIGLTGGGTTINQVKVIWIPRSLISNPQQNSLDASLFNAGHPNALVADPTPPNQATYTLDPDDILPPPSNGQWIMGAYLRNAAGQEKTLNLTYFPGQSGDENGFIRFDKTEPQLCFRIDLGGSNCYDTCGTGGCNTNLFGATLNTAAALQTYMLDNSAAVESQQDLDWFHFPGDTLPFSNSHPPYIEVTPTGQGSPQAVTPQWNIGANSYYYAMDLAGSYRVVRTLNNNNSAYTGAYAQDKAGNKSAAPGITGPFTLQGGAKLTAPTTVTPQDAKSTTTSVFVRVQKGANPTGTFYVEVEGKQGSRTLNIVPTQAFAGSSQEIELKATPNLTPNTKVTDIRARFRKSATVATPLEDSKWEPDADATPAEPLEESWTRPVAPTAAPTVGTITGNSVQATFAFPSGNPPGTEYSVIAVADSVSTVDPASPDVIAQSSLIPQATGNKTVTLNVSSGLSVKLAVRVISGRHYDQPSPDPLHQADPLDAYSPVTQNPVVISAPNPKPAITEVLPSQATVGSAAIDLEIYGSGFVPGTTAAPFKVFWDATQLSGVQVDSSGQLAAARVPANLLTTARTAKIKVQNPTPCQGGSCDSNLVDFVVAPVPVPKIDKLTPETAVQGSQGVSILIDGSNFDQSTVGRWNSSNRFTTLISPNQISMDLLDSDLATAQIYAVTVRNGASGPISNLLSFTVTQKLKPAISSLSPSTVVAGNAAFTLTVNGSNFDSTAVVYWNGEERATTFRSTSRLEAAINRTDVQHEDTVQVRVVNGNGEISTPVNFEILPPASPTLALSLPSSANPDQSVLLRVIGTNFINGDSIVFDGQPLTTTLINATTLQANVPSALMQNPSTSPRDVFITLERGGSGVPGSLTFRIRGNTGGGTPGGPDCTSNAQCGPTETCVSGKCQSSGGGTNPPPPPPTCDPACEAHETCTASGTSASCVPQKPIVNLSKTVGAANAPLTLTITGNYFGTDPIVLFGGTDVSDGITGTPTNTSITLTIPATIVGPTARSVVITVRNAGSQEGSATIVLREKHGTPSITVNNANSTATTFELTVTPAAGEQPTLARVTFTYLSGAADTTPTPVILPISNSLVTVTVPHPNLSYRNIQVEVRGDPQYPADFAWSDKGQSATAAYTKPVKPKKPGSIALAADAVTAFINFEAENGPPDNSDGSGYVIQVSSQADFSPNAPNFFRESSPPRIKGQGINQASVNGLLADTAYYIRTRVLSADGDTAKDQFSDPDRFSTTRLTGAFGGVINARTETSLTATWSLNAVSGVTSYRINAVNDSNTPIGAGQASPAPNALLITSLVSNATYHLNLQGYKDNSYWANFDDNSLIRNVMTLAAKPGKPVLNLSGSITNGFFLDVAFGPDTNSVLSRYAIKVSAPGVPPGYLANLSGGTSIDAISAQPVWLTQAEWTASNRNRLITRAIDTLYTFTVLVEQRFDMTTRESDSAARVTPGTVRVTSFEMAGIDLDQARFGLSGDASVRVTFTEGMNPSITSASDKLFVERWDGNAFTRISIGTIDYNDDNNLHTATLSPGSLVWEPNRIYRVRVLPGLRDIWDFQTKEEFSQLFVTTPDMTHDNTVTSPIEPSAANRIDLPREALPQGGFVILRSRFVQPSAPISSPNTPREASLVRFLRTAEVLIYNSAGSSPAAPSLSGGAPAKSLKNMTLTLAPNPAVADQLKNIDLATLTLFLVTPNGQLIPVPGAKVNADGSVSAPINTTGVYILGASVATNLSSAHPYPVPFKPSDGHTVITFTGLAADSTIKIFTIMGEEVASLHNDAGAETKDWNVTNKDGDKVASGVYIYQIKNAFSEKRGKLVIIR